MVKDLYELDLHEEINIPYIANILRVPGGWIYRFWDYKKDRHNLEGVFVPFNNDFQIKY